jgi:hypothetical protein
MAHTDGRDLLKQAIEAKLARAAERANLRRFTGAPPSGFAELGPELTRDQVEAMDDMAAWSVR